MLNSRLEPVPGEITEATKAVTHHKRDEFSNNYVGHDQLW